MRVVGIDIGTSKICGLSAELSSGEVLWTRSTDNDAGMPSSRPWEERQDPARIEAVVRELLADCREGAGAAEAIGIACQMHGIVYVDSRGHAVSPLYTWQDRRGNLPFAGEETYAAALARITGHPLASGYGMVTHFHLARNGEIPRDAAGFCTIGDYLAMRLCGRTEPLLDASNAASLGLYAPALGDFDRDAAKRAGLAASMLPRVAASGVSAFGTAEDGAVVARAIGDNQAGFIGAVPNLEGAVLYNIGTGAQVSVFAREPKAGGMLEARPFPGGGWLLVGASLAGGKSYALLERFFRDVCAAFAAPADRSLYERMNALAIEAMEDAAGLPDVEPLFYGTRHDAGATAGIRGLNPHNFTPRHLVLGMLQGIVRELTGLAAEFPAEAAERIQLAAGAGNGIRRNPAMRRLLAQELGMPLYLSDVEEEAAFGAAIYAGVAAGTFADLPEAIARMHRRNE